MPSLADHQSSHITKMLLIGDSGSGKTGSLASLAAAGYNLRILDCDNGIDVLLGVLRDPKSPYKDGEAAVSRITYQTITEQMAQLGGKLVPKGDAWRRLIGQLSHWKSPSEDLGPVAKWTEQDVLVLDSMTFAGTYAMNFVLSLNGRLGQRPHQSDWYDAQQLLEGLLQMLYDESIRCNVIVTSHVAFLGEENSTVSTGYPMALGKALPPKVGRYFNTILLVRSAASGTSVKRSIVTQSTRMASGIVELKNTAPLRVSPEYALESGLAEYFKAIRIGAAKPPQK